VKWLVHGERPIYESEWVNLTLADVEVPGGPRYEHHVVRMPSAASGVVVHDDERGVLLLWRHRFITDTWGWEVPAGRIDPGETAEEAAAREVLEETGWRPGPLTLLTAYHPNNGQSDLVFNLFAAAGATYVSDPIDWSESERVEWVPAADVRRAVAHHEVHDGLSLTALLWWLTLGG
jgi:8-oxo-dGTP pyrophosphatase MutT (NUDIX family)